MRFLSMRALAAAAALVGLSLSGAVLAAKPQAQPGDANLITPVFTPLGVDARPVTVVVKLPGASVAEQEGNAGRRYSRAEKDQAKQQLKSKQDVLRGSIAALGGTVIAQYQSAYDGIKVRIGRDKLAQLAALPGVSAVKPLLLMNPTNIRSVPYIGAPAVWQGLGLHGEGIKVAIIDTGIDYTHANFGGPGTSAAYDTAHAAEAAPADPHLFGPDAPRVKGGIDLVGDDYDAGDPNSVPHPDPNPLDCNGHGSHVAGTAAGSGVKADGTTYNGPYDANTDAVPGDWIIGPGVAPKADLYAIRVFGCAGSTNMTVDAIDWAVDHDMDVINMSLGSPFGLADDPSAEASTNAAKAGIVVVAAAGNEGPSPYMTGSPGTADGAISVAANDSTQSFPAALITVNGATLPAIDANGFPLAPSATYTVKVTNNLGCSVADFGGPLPPNTIAVVRRGTCARVAKAIFGQQAGAAAVAMLNTDGTFPPFEGPITSDPDNGMAFTVTIPFLGVPGPFTSPTSPAGKLAAAGGATAVVKPASIRNPSFEAFASFSSAGPRSGDSALKPEITAPGVGIFSTAMGTGNGAANFSGTSMATPHVTGVAALTLQAHPSWKVDDIKAAIVGTGAPSKVAHYAVSRGGTGLVQPASSTATQVVASVNGARFGASLNFGYQELTNDFSGTQAISLRNNGASSATFNVAQANASGSAHTLTIDKSTVTVPAHASATVIVKLAVPAASAGDSSAFNEVAGLVQFTPASSADNAGVALRVPYYLVPDARSNVSVDLGKLSGADPTATATVTNRNGTVAGTADFYAWGLGDSQDNNHAGDARNVTNDVRAIGTQSFPDGAGGQFVVFAVNTWNRWSNAASNEFDIYVDVDGDGIDDYVVVGVDNGAVTTGEFDGQMAVFVFSQRSAGASELFFANAPTDGSVAELPIHSSQLCRSGEPCLSASNPRFTYHAVSFDLVNGGSDTVSGSATFNAWQNAITTGGFAAVGTNATDTSNSVAIDSTEWLSSPALGLMAVSLENRSGAGQAQLIQVKVK